MMTGLTRLMVINRSNVGPFYQARVSVRSGPSRRSDVRCFGSLFRFCVREQVVELGILAGAQVPV